jgi:hypothetical protein
VAITITTATDMFIMIMTTITSMTTITPMNPAV